MSAFEDFIQVELPRRPWVIDAGTEESILVRRGAGPRQSVWVSLNDNQVLAKVSGTIQGVDISSLASIGGGSTIKTLTSAFDATTGWTQHTDGTWYRTFTHSHGSTNVVVSIYDNGATPKVIIPSEVEIIDGSNIRVYLGEKAAGKLVAFFV